MDWKREAVEKLKQYEAHKRALESIPAALRRLEEQSTAIRSAETDATPVQGGGSTREDALLSNIVHREELEHRLSDAKAWVQIVDGGLAVLDEEERLVLELFYIHRAKGNVDRLCEKLRCEKATAYRHRDKALHHFTVALYGIE